MYPITQQVKGGNSIPNFLTPNITYLYKYWKKIVKKISSLSINVLYSETCMMKNLQWDKNYVFQKF